MFRCLDCKKKFDEPMLIEETHGFTNPPFENRYVCPHCRSTNYKLMLKDTFSRRRIIADVLEIMVRMNDFEFLVSDAFNSTALEDTAFDEARGMLYELLTVLSGDEVFALPHNIDEAIFSMRTDCKRQLVYGDLVYNIEEED